MSVKTNHGNEKAIEMLNATKRKMAQYCNPHWTNKKVAWQWNETSVATDFRFSAPIKLVMYMVWFTYWIRESANNKEISYQVILQKVGVRRVLKELHDSGYGGHYDRFWE